MRTVRAATARSCGHGNERDLDFVELRHPVDLVLAIGQQLGDSFTRSAALGGYFDTTSCVWSLPDRSMHPSDV